jgi:hypothetical protein
MTKTGKLMGKYHETIFGKAPAPWSATQTEESSWKKGRMSLDVYEISVHGLDVSCAVTGE